MSGRRALVTGAGGFIGSHLVEDLLAHDWTVRALVHYRGEGGIGWLADGPIRSDRCEIVRGDVCNADHLRDLAAGCNVIFNLAALAGPTYSFTAPEQYLHVNVGGCFAALQAARHHGCVLVQQSTSEVYGTAQVVPMDETHPIAPHSPYGASKAAADAFCGAFERSYDLDVRIARPFNVYGPRQSQRAIIPTIVAQVLRHSGPGPCEVSVADPQVRRDFTFVSDTVRGLRLIAEAPRSVAVAGPLNLASGGDVSLGDIARIVGEAVGVEARAVVDSTHARPSGGEVRRLYGSSARARAVIGWEPVTPFRAGIAQVVEWLRPRTRSAATGRIC